MYPYQNQPSHSGQHGPSSSQQFLENMETAASRFKRAFGRKRPSRGGDDDQQGTQSDAPTTMRKMTPVSRISQFIPRKDPKSALQAATSSFQVLGQRLNKPLPPRVPSQIGPPPDLDLSRPPPPSPSPPPIREQDTRRTSEEPRKSQSKTRSSPVPVSPKTVYRTSQLVGGPEISAAIEYMLDSPPKHGTSPPLSRALEPASVSPPSPKVMRRGSYGKDNNNTTTTTTPTALNPTTKRRSMSLSMIPHFQANVTPPPPLPASSSSYQQAPPSSFTMQPPPPANLTHQRSHSTLPTFTTSPSVAEPSAAQTDAYASGIITHMTPDKNSSTSSFKGKLSAWSTPPTTPTHSPSRPNRNPSPSHSHSKTASVVASFGPAATAATGLAVNFSKRAYEKVNSMWSGPASASPNSGGGMQYGQHGSEPSGNISRVKSRLNGGSHGSYGGSFSDVEPSRRRMGNSSSGSGAHPSAMQEPPIGPNLGTMLRPPFRRSIQNGGLVFGRPLADCVRDTKPLVVVGSESGAGIEARFIPALVLRCVQHIEQWGITEEGLFRISGRTSHINKLRAEFASGADYDLQMCGPGDLDPHAVASVLKAFLRELPEPILTRNKAPLYDLAFERAKDASFMLATSSAPPTLGYNPSPHMGLPSGPRMGLPSGPRDTSTLPLRNRNAHVPPPDPSAVDEMGGSSSTPQQALEELITEFRDLTWSLPRENRDLLLTITELLQKAAGESRTTKMPLSNLLLVLCPSMSMNPGVLKIFVEHHQEIFADPPSPVQNEQRQSHLQPEKVVNAPEAEPKAVIESVPAAPPTEIQNQVSPTPAQVHEEPKQILEGVIPTNALPVRKQSLRRLAQGSQSPRTTPTSSPSAYKETFAADPSFNKPDSSVAASELTVEQPRNSSRPTSPLRQSFSSSDLSRPAQPLGPRGPRALPTPLTLQRERSNTPERQNSVSRHLNLRSASSLSSFSQEQMKPVVPEASKVEEPAAVQAVPELLVESQPILVSQNVDSAPPSSQGDVLEIPILPDVQLPPPMTSSFANRRSAMPMTQPGQAIPSAGLSDGPSPVHTPQTADSGMSSQGNTVTFPPSLPEVHSLPPMTSTFAQRKSVMPMPRTEETQASVASLSAPSPDSAGNAVQPLTPLLAAMELENPSNSSSFPPSPDPNPEHQTHLRVEPLTLIKKRTSHGNEPESAISTASSAFTDSTDATFDQQLSWPEVPKTIPMVKPGYYAMLNQQTSSNATLQQSSQQSDQDTTAQFVTAGKRDSSDLTAKVDQNNFPAELHDDDNAPVSPDVPNGQYPPDPYSLMQPVPQVPDVPQPTNMEPKARKDSSERVTVALSQAARGKRMSSGDQYNTVPLVDSTVRPVRAHAPRLTVNSKEMLAGNSYWANELQRVLRSSPPTSPHEARHSAELSSMLEAAGT